MRTDIDGVSVQVFFEGQELTIEADGAIGRTTRAGSYELRVTILGRKDLRAFLVDRQKNVNLLRAREVSDDLLYVYGRKIPLMWYPEKSVTVYATNNLRLLEVVEDGFIKIWEVAVVVQDYNAFVTVQNTWRVPCYHEEIGLITCPQFADWPSMLQFLNEVLCEVSSIFPNAMSIHQESPKILPDLSDDEGEVIFWSDAQQWGAARTNIGSVRVYWDQIRQSGRRMYLRSGDRIRFDALRTPHHSKGSKHTTGFTREAVGVDLCN